ncbi:MAG: calcium-binding protein [Planctomycetes bacterium]|nr:calcium-binding protein [Planctomycetota bacterium]
MALPLFALLLCVTTEAAPQQFVTHRVSLDSTGQEAIGASLRPDLSSDGRHLGFQSSAPLANLASGFTDIYVRDRVDGTTTLLSVGNGGVAANSFSSGAQLSHDGRFVVFASSASNLVTGDTNGVDDIFLADRDPDQNGTFDEGNISLIRVSLALGGVEPNAPCSSPSISGDGRWICFASLATNLVAGDTNAASDVFAWDRTTGQIRLISVDGAGAQGDGPSTLASLSGDGRFVAFESLATNLVASDVNGARDIFLRDRDPDQNGIFDEAGSTTSLISVSTLGAQANQASAAPSIDDSGSVVCFQSTASNLAVGTGGGTSQVYVRIRSTGRTELCSMASNGSAGNADSVNPVLSSNGGVLAFESRASNLVTGDTNGWDDVFRVDLVGRTMARASVRVDGGQSTLYSQRPALNGNGTEVAFQSPAEDLVAHDTNSSFDVFVRGSGSWSPQLLLDPLIRGQLSQARICNMNPNETVALIYSVTGTGNGLCPPQLGGLCLDLLSPSLLGTQIATTMGVADIQFNVPAGAPLIPVYAQAAIARGVGGASSVKSNVVVQTIQP